MENAIILTCLNCIFHLKSHGRFHNFEVQSIVEFKMCLGLCYTLYFAVNINEFRYFRVFVLFIMQRESMDGCNFYSFFFDLAFDKWSIMKSIEKKKQFYNILAYHFFRIVVHFRCDKMSHCNMPPQIKSLRFFYTANWSILA